MSNLPRRQDIRGAIVADAGGEQAVAEARHRSQARIDGHRLAERRKAPGLTQAQAAGQTGVTNSRVSQAERGEVSAIEAAARHVTAIGGTIQVSAVSGDDHYILRGTATEAARPSRPPPSGTLPRSRRHQTLAAATPAGTWLSGASRHGWWR